jgi:hypothetical protein
VRALAGGSASFQAELVRIIADYVKDPAEREQLHSLLA